MTAAVPLIEREWEEETGFLGLLRAGTFDTDAYARLLSALESVEVDAAATTPDRRFVELTRQIPDLMLSQLERIREHGEDTVPLQEAQDRLSGILDSLIGKP